MARSGGHPGPFPSSILPGTVLPENLSTHWYLDDLVGFKDELAQFPEISQIVLDEALNEILELLYEATIMPQERPTYPIHWDSEKQRKAFFGTFGFGRGIPTERSGFLQDSWTCEYAEMAPQPIGEHTAAYSSSVMLYSECPYTQFTEWVGRQSLIFLDAYEPVEYRWEGFLQDADPGKLILGSVAQAIRYRRIEISTAGGIPH